jgi:aspartyl-tRNA(Asn)/glutamyl-tRNA(Gln) amidotransferase subunit C
MDAEKVLKLAELARVRVSREEAEKLSHEFDAILNYVSEVKDVSKTESPELKLGNFPIRNVMREDGEGHEPRIHTEAFLAAAPAREGDYFKVKNIL